MRFDLVEASEERESFRAETKKFCASNISFPIGSGQEHARIQQVFQKCGPDLWNYAQIIGTNLLDELTKAELVELGIKSEKK